MTTLEDIEKELKVIKEQTRTSIVKYNTMIFMLDKICKALKIEVRK